MDLQAATAATRALGARWSISIRRLDQAEPVAELDAGTLLRTASIAKMFLLIELAERLADRSIDGGELVDRRRTAPVHDSGLWHALRAERLPVADLALLVGSVSDNWATNALIDLCGLERVQERAAALAPGGSMLMDIVRDDRSGPVPECLSVGCARDWAMIAQRLHLADGLDAGVCRAVRSWLAQDCDLSMVAAAFDLDPLAHDVEDLGLCLWHKTGTDAGVRADVGVLASPGAAVGYAVLCNWPPDDRRPQTRAEVLAAMRTIGAGIRELAGA